MTLVDRYRTGEFGGVWDELLAMGAQARDPDLMPQVVAVAEETMRRARVNVERLSELLPRSGWRFQYPLIGAPGLSVWSPPTSDTAAQLARLEIGLGGPVPISLASWWTTVGSVCLMRIPDSGPAVAYPDPLVVYPPEVVLTELMEWSRDEFWREEQPRFRGPLAPDAHHKEDVSGGSPYEIALPDPSADARVLNMEPATAFVAYLRHAFAWAGLPGYAEVYDEPPPMIAAIAAELLPL